MEFISWVSAHAEQNRELSPVNAYPGHYGTCTLRSSSTAPECKLLYNVIHVHTYRYMYHNIVHLHRLMHLPISKSKYIINFTLAIR